LSISIKKRYNVHDVAKAAGVSSMTVTRVFNSSAPVAPATREKVMAVAKKLNYRPNRMARTLRQGRSHSIGLLWSLSGPHDSAAVVRQMTSLASQGGYVTYLTDSMSDPGLIEDCLTDLIERKVDGLIIQAPTDELDVDKYRTLLREIGQVVVVASHKPEGPLHFDLLHRDIMHGIDECLSALYESGRCKIALLFSQKQKLDEVKESLADRPFINCLDFLEVQGDHQKVGYHVFADSLQPYLDQGNKYDAICCSCDEGAAQVINLLHERNLRVPEDVAVCGINNTSITECFRPRIASIERNNNMVASAAVEMLLQRIKKPELPPRYKKVNMEFIPRESAGLKII
jgi:DNA-binding LacI/PurR family transcriptional regulator